MREDQNCNIPELVYRQIAGTITDDEREILKEWVSLSERNKSLFEQLTGEENLIRTLNAYDEIDTHKAWEKISPKLHRRYFVKRNSLVLVLRYAAIILLPLLVVSYLLFQKTQLREADSVFDQLVNQIAASEESSLILSTGEIISLNSTLIDSVVDVDGTHISRSDSTIVYEKVPVSSGKFVKFNTLVTPVARVYSVLLPDGSRVWLNASSAIRYPTQFATRERKVFLTGEAYFEVATDQSRPFIVSTKELEVVATGTSFNVMAYPDDNQVVTTLVSGEVRVAAADRSLVLNPGSQASLDLTTKSLEKHPVVIEHYTSWISGKYIFNRTNLDEVMSKLSRWYDFKVSYATDGLIDLHFTGTLYKYEDLNRIFEIIEISANIEITYTDEGVLVARKMQKEN